MRPEQTRYDLVPNLLIWLVRSGAVTEPQARSVAEKATRDFKQHFRPLGERLMSEGASEPRLRQALGSLNLLDPDPLDLSRAGSSVSPITRMIGLILGSFVDASAETLEFQTDGRGMHVRYRLEGIWWDMETIPVHLAEPVLDRLRELTATGKLLVRVDGKPLDLIVDSNPPAFRLRVEPAGS